MDHKTDTTQEDLETKSSLSRRSFLAGAAVTAAGATALGMLGGSSLASASEVAAPGANAGDFGISPAGAQYPWPANPPEISDANVELEIDCDVVVVGLGVAGCAAYRAAAEGGAKVVAFEKASQPCQRSSQYAYINGPHSEAWGLATWNEKDLLAMIQTEVKEMNYMVKQDIWFRWARESAEAIEWYCKGVPGFFMPETAADFPAGGMGGPPPGEGEGEGGGAAAEPAPPSLSTGPGANPDTDYSEDRNAYNVTLFFSDHQAMLNGQVTTAEGLGGETFFGHFGEKLIMENGRCVGAYARNAETGKYVKANASKGVIMATGDYFSNTDMVRFFRPDLIENGNFNNWPNRDVEGERTNTGDGYKMGYWAGASLQLHHAPMTHVMGGIMSARSSMGLMGTAPYLRINWFGNRFMNEEISNVNTEYPINLQPRHQYLVIFDSKFADYPELGGMMGAISQDRLDSSVESGAAFKGDTLEELLDNLQGTDDAGGMDAESKANAIATIKRYNELVAKGFDEDFNKSPKYLKPIETGPFYAELTGPALCLVVIGGGLESDKEAHVLDRERRVIPGLYASGNIQGNRFAIKYPFKLGGASHCTAMFYGYVAGQNAAKGV